MTIKVNVITRGRSFESALAAVRREMRAFGCWTKPVSDLAIYQTPIGLSYGLQRYKGSGDIVIPHISFSRMWDNWFGGGYVSIRDIIRHEYAHGIAHCHPKMVSLKTFKTAFKGDHDKGTKSSYDPEEHVSAYATKNPCEDFAEVFMYYLKHNGKIPRSFAGLPAIEKKWSFVKTMCGKLSKLKQGD